MSTLEVYPVSAKATTLDRPSVRGKFLFLGVEKFYVKGVTYGPFRPDKNGNQYGDLNSVERDFAQISANGTNAVRTYTVPPLWLLDAALRNGLRVMVGLPWEQHVTFLDTHKLPQAIEERVRAGVRACAQHPALLCYTIGNEIPAPVVRWHGTRGIERYLERLFQAAKAEDPQALFTYVNYPSTEYLHLPFLDLVCFNVYLESQDRYDAYLARLHNLAGDRPVIMTEIGLDSRRNGEEAQAQSLDWLVRTTFAGGCGGTFVFAWTDEWHRGGYDIMDWDFGLTDRRRRPKKALHSVAKAYAEVPLPPDLPWPRISVVVCTYNGSRTIRECLGALSKLDYPNFEVIVVDDGSTDGAGDIARDYGVRVISTPNRGLSSARNTGMEAATGEIVAYVDDDAYPDPHWLAYYAAAFRSTKFAGLGGPNIPPPGDGLIADCVSNSPGGPIHVLLSDREAEHIPGCNMAFRKAVLQAVGGFDAKFRVAGDDVDLCWRLQHQGAKLGFVPAAAVFHHRRNSVRAYWRQQKGYGKAEAYLERKWPGKYNAAGHVNWGGRVYGSRGLISAPGWHRCRIYQGTWGTAPYQSIYPPATGLLASLPLMPEWYLIVAALAAISAIGFLWKPLFLAFPLLLLATAAPVTEAIMSAAQASFTSTSNSWFERFKLRALTTTLHLLQPLARLRGRLNNGLTPWRKRGSNLALPRWRTLSLWNEEWQPAEVWLESLETSLLTEGAVVVRGGDYDRWDLEIKGGLLGATRTRMVIEEHGAGKQMVRFRLWPWCPPFGVGISAIFAALCTAATLDQAWIACAVLGGIALLLAVRIFRECAVATAAFLRTLEQKKSQLAETLLRNATLGKNGAPDSGPQPETKVAGASAGELDPAFMGTLWENEEAS